MNQDSHVKLFEKLIFAIELKRSGFCNDLRYFENEYEPSFKRPTNYRLIEYLKNKELDFYKGKFNQANTT